jgi:hypothetical protein
MLALALFLDLSVPVSAAPSAHAIAIKWICAVAEGRVPRKPLERKYAREACDEVRDNGWPDSPSVGEFAEDEPGVMDVWFSLTDSREFSGSYDCCTSLWSRRLMVRVSGGRVIQLSVVEEAECEDPC